MSGVTSPTEPARPNARIAAVADAIAEHDVDMTDKRLFRGGDPLRDYATPESVARVAVRVLDEFDARESSDAEKLRAEKNALIAGLRLVRSVPVVTNDDRHGYDCAGCGAWLGQPHEEACPWETAMKIVRAAVSESVSSPLLDANKITSASPNLRGYSTQVPTGAGTRAESVSSPESQK